MTHSRFLDSEFASLRAGQTGRPFKIHRKLLSSKSKPLSAALDSELKEGQNGVYAFEEVTEGTLARFVEWAYRGDYPTPIGEIQTVQAQHFPDAVEASIDGKSTVTTPETDFTSENHPLLVHIRLYIFSHTYLINELQQLSYEKVTTCLTDLDKPDGLDIQLAVVDALRLAFYRLPQHDCLLDWLAQYSAYCIDKLRVQGSFHDLLRDFPTLSSRMILSLSPASSPPWRTTRPKYNFTQYSAKWSGEYKYNF